MSSLARQALRLAVARTASRHLCSAPSLLERVRAMRALDEGKIPARLREDAAARHIDGDLHHEDAAHDGDDDDHLYQELPLHVRPYAADVERYIVHAWVKQYPLGARLRKLQRDIAFRMPRPHGEQPGKMDMDELKQLVCLLRDRGVIEVIESTEPSGSPKTIVVARERHSSGTRDGAAGSDSAPLPDPAGAPG